MTDRELMQQALEALELAYAGIDAITVYGKAITALKERLAQPEQEPVAWISEGGDVSRSKRYMDEMGFECNPLYAAPQRRDWVGLTVKEIVITAEACGGLASDFVVDVARAIEAKLKEKNT